jgi:hypothetical protein
MLTDVDLNADSRHDDAKKIGEIFAAPWATGPRERHPQSVGAMRTNVTGVFSRVRRWRRTLSFLFESRKGDC